VPRSLPRALSRLALVLRLARRNVARNRRRTAVILAAISVGLWAMLFYAAFSRGWENDVVDGAIRTLTGHLQIHAAGYLDDPSVDHSMAPPDAALRRLLDGPEVAAWAGRVRLPAVVQSERETAGVTLVGIDPGAERGLSFIAGAVDEGRALASPDDRGIVLGRALAERLATGVGKRVVLLSQAADHSVADRGFTVVGLFAADREDTELGFAFVGRRRAAEMLGLGDRLSEISVLLRDRSRLGVMVDRLRGAAPGLDVEPWTTLEPLSQAVLSLAESWIWIFYLVMYVAMAFGLVNTLLMAVLERTRELGLLQALGMRPRLILGQVIAEAALLLAAGIAAGGALTAASLALLAGGIDVSGFAQGAELWGMSKVIHPALAAADVFSAVVLVIALGLLASLYPALRAARRVPVEAITRG
jgi:ABC-type lipoprotein release transport system permease subunit